MKDFVTLIRPQQWLKCLFVFLPLFFDRHLLDVGYLVPCCLTFLAYCFTSSSVYCFNDIHDRESDRLHPGKCRRPIASGSIPVMAGYACMLLMLALGAAFVALLPKETRWEVAAVLLVYYAMNVAYCVCLKRIAVVDVFIIATGFVLRVVAGGVSTRIGLSHWIVLMTFLLALFLAFAKRRDDVIIYEETDVKPRANINRYNLPFMNQALSIIASVTMVCYIMYTVSEEVTARMDSHLLYLTSVFVLAGIIRYLQLTIVDAKSGSPTRVLLKDRFVQYCILGWLLLFGLILYL